MTDLDLLRDYWGVIVSASAVITIGSLLTHKIAIYLGGRKEIWRPDYFHIFLAAVYGLWIGIRVMTP
jgi:hypothetical protein